MKPATIAALSAIAVLALAVGVQSWRLDGARKAEIRARAERTAAEMVAAGWERTARASQRELAAIVPALKAEIEAAKKAGATIAGTQHWEGRGKAIRVQCSQALPGQQPGQPENAKAGEAVADTPAGSPTHADVEPGVKIDDAVAIDDAGGIYVKRKVQARLTAGAWASPWEDIAPEVTNAAPSIDPKISKAWELFVNPPPRLQGFIGASMGLDGPGVAGGASGGKGMLGWWASADYVLADPERSRVQGGLSITPKP